MKNETANYNDINKTLKKLKKQIKSLPDGEKNNKLLTTVKSIKSAIKGNFTVELSENAIEKPVLVTDETEIKGLIAEHLKAQKVTIEEYQPIGTYNENLKFLAEFMADNIEYLSDILLQIRRKVNHANARVAFILPDNSVCVQFFSMLVQYNFIQKYTYIEKRMHDSLVECIFYNKAENIMFLLGRWLEIYVFSLFEQHLKDKKLGEVMTGVKTVDRLGMRAEFDILASYKGKLYWVECKTGKSFDMSKYVDISKTYKFGRDTSFVVTSSTAEGMFCATNGCIDYYDQITVVKIALFKEIINNIFKD